MMTNVLVVPFDKRDRDTIIQMHYEGMPTERIAYAMHLETLVVKVIIDRHFRRASCHQKN
jgi:hypothetical protein